MSEADHRKKGGISMRLCKDCAYFVDKDHTLEHVCISPSLISLIHGQQVTEKCIDVRRNTSNDFATSLCGISGDWYEPNSIIKEQ